jgi:hypothetical protein
MKPERLCLRSSQMGMVNEALGRRQETGPPGVSMAFAIVTADATGCEPVHPVGSALFDFRFLVQDMLAHDGIELLDLHLFGHVFLVLGGRIEVAGAGAGYQFDFVAHGGLNLEFQIFSPRLRMSANTASMPRLSMMRKPWLETRRRTHRFSLSTQNRRSCRFGLNSRLVLLLAWETLWPTIRRLPVTWHTLDMVNLYSPGWNRKTMFYN